VVAHPAKDRDGMAIVGAMGRRVDVDQLVGAAEIADRQADRSSHIFGILDRLRHLGIEVRRFETYWPDDPDASQLKRTNQEES
jgi:hypothetical protein